jgi:hypothetical protein
MGWVGLGCERCRWGFEAARVSRRRWCRVVWVGGQKGEKRKRGWDRQSDGYDGVRGWSLFCGQDRLGWGGWRWDGWASWVASGLSDLETVSYAE